MKRNYANLYDHNLRAAKRGSIFVLNIGTYRDRTARSGNIQSAVGFHSAFSRREKIRMTNDRTKSVLHDDDGFRVYLVVAPWSAQFHGQTNIEDDNDSVFVR